MTKFYLYFIFNLVCFCASAQTTFFYEDFRYNGGKRGFTGQVVQQAGQVLTELNKIVSDIPDASDSSFGEADSRPANRIPQNEARDQRAIITSGTNATTSTNFPIDVYTVLTTVDLTASNPLIPAEDAYRYASFWTQRKYGEGDLATITVLVATDYKGDARTAQWTVIPLLSGKLATTADKAKFVKAIVDLSSYAKSPNGKTVTLALHYQGSDTPYSAAKRNGSFSLSDVQFISQPKKIKP